MLPYKDNPIRLITKLSDPAQWRPEVGTNIENTE